MFTTVLKLAIILTVRPNRS